MAGEEHDRIGARARKAIDGDEEILISAVVIWEIAIKRRLGKLDAPADLLVRLEGADVDLLPITARHADRVGDAAASPSRPLRPPPCRPGRDRRLDPRQRRCGDAPLRDRGALVMGGEPRHASGMV
jgi:hypothetical protein